MLVELATGTMWTHADYNWGLFLVVDVAIGSYEIYNWQDGDDEPVYLDNVTSISQAEQYIEEFIKERS